MWKLFPSTASLLLAAPALAGSVSLEPAADNTLYNSFGGFIVSNGSGEHVFTGTNGSGEPRRALLRFDVAGAVPAGATITSAELRMTMSRTRFDTPARDTSLHRLLASWGEGASVAYGEEGGGGVPDTGDATWVSRFHPDVPWSGPGASGDFVPAASATIGVTSIGPYVWGSTPAMVADVQSWLDTPASSFGWIVIGDQSGTSSAKRFQSRENGNALERPMLTITFEGAPAVPATSNAGIAAVCVLLAGLGVWQVSRSRRLAAG